MRHLWLTQKGKWIGLRSIGMTKNTITKDGKETTYTRYFISSLGLNEREFSRCVRKHWMVESFHWHLDVTFREDANKTLEKQTALNLNIIRKFALSILKLTEIGKPKTSMKLKRYYFCTNPTKFLSQILVI
jgi:predicted transposase YbfD/YdcC